MQILGKLSKNINQILIKILNQKLIDEIKILNI
jgi:hypothetical protein